MQTERRVAALRPNQPIWAASLPKDWLLPYADTMFDLFDT